MTKILPPLSLTTGLECAKVRIVLEPVNDFGYLDLSQLTLRRTIGNNLFNEVLNSELNLSCQ